ncbi:hypothetical protein UFOVP965_90 [uncultured Caudovirales phage]|uniref:Uncharacterized protein n=1 Tax=uncultured Caudovirales phage TaxID=2100421 RepID=A0A6J5QEC8_9CAUD|nr:hypothetical protein UFOVP965_90 [uncultured Caudovirales phage]CAB4179861.1 hypothetical protein UFOVP1035_86 [uncultured Caudovirales phage]CAB4188653.1 hypothetical protein UFOVP1181_45 [uncultured Caudovirales phage]
MKYGIMASFEPHSGVGDSKVTYYDERVFRSAKRAIKAINGEYGEILAQSATLDTENENDLQGYYLDDLYVYGVTT